eukprot:scaffold68208_cov30-Prasinocladus_malaysianus.AAC.1
MDLAEARHCCTHPSCFTSKEDFEEEAVVPLAAMPYDGTAETYVVLAKPEGAMTLGNFVNILRFTVKEVDPSTGEAEEDG